MHAAECGLRGVNSTAAHSIRLLPGKVIRQEMLAQHEVAAGQPPKFARKTMHRETSRLRDIDTAC
jgi:hypothetical protein